MAKKFLDQQSVNVDDAGNVYVRINIDDVGIGGGTQYAVDTALGATPTGTLAVAKRDDALSALTPVEGDAVELRVDANGALWTHDDALDAALAGSELQVDIVASLPAGTNAIGKLAANSGVDIGDVDILSIAAGDNNIGNVDIVSLPALVAGTANIGDVDILSIIPGTGPTNLGKAEDAVHTSGDVGVMFLGVANEANSILAADGDYVPLAVDTEGSRRNIGNRAHDAVDSGAPVKIGLKAIAHGTNPTAVAAADRTDWYGNRAGVPFVIGGHPNVVTLEAAYTSAQTDTAIITILSGLKIVVTAIDFVCDNANTVNVAVRIGFGTTTTPTTTGVVLTHPGVAAGSGVVRGNGAGILGVGADGEDLRITAGAPTTGSMRVLVSYYTIES